MPAANHLFSIEQGSDFQITFNYVDENNIPVNLTNWYVLFKFVSNTGQIYSFDNITQTSDYSLKGLPTGDVVLYIPARITNNYTFDTANYDLDLQEPNEQYPGSGLRRYRLAQGTITFIKRNTTIPAFDVIAPINGQVLDACDLNCSQIGSTVYTGSGLTISDNAPNYSYISFVDSRPIDTIEVSINGLNHKNPQDLSMFLSPPSGDKILLFAHHKINNYVPGFSFMLSDRAIPQSTVNNVINGGSCKIIDRTNSIRFNNSIPTYVCNGDDCSYVNIPFNITSSGVVMGALNNENLRSSFAHLQGYAPSGSWYLHVMDNDVGSSGLIDNWKLIINYQE